MSTASPKGGDPAAPSVLTRRGWWLLWCISGSGSIRRTDRRNLHARQLSRALEVRLLALPVQRLPGHSVSWLPMCGSPSTIASLSSLGATIPVPLVLQFAGAETDSETGSRCQARNCTRHSDVANPGGAPGGCLVTALGRASLGASCRQKGLQTLKFRGPQNMHALCRQACRAAGG